MALTVAHVQNAQLTGQKMRIKRVTFDSSYATGGESLTAAQLGLNSIRSVQAEPASGYVFQYDYTNNKLKAYYGDNNNAADGPLIEVPNTTDLSAISTRVVAYGL